MKKPYDKTAMCTRKYNDVIIIPIVVLLLLITLIRGYRCPIEYFTGISCAGCGMTRAWKEVLQLDFAEAFHYHPLFIMPLLIFVIYFLRDKIGLKRYKLIISISVAFFLGVYLYRLVSSCDDIVAVNLREGQIYKMIVN